MHKQYKYSAVYYFDQVDALLEELRHARTVFEEAEKPRVHDALAKEQRKVGGPKSVVKVI